MVGTKGFNMLEGALWLLNYLTRSMCAA